MTSQNDQQDESLTGQAHDQAGHCPLTGRYFEPWTFSCTELKTHLLLWKPIIIITELFAIPNPTLWSPA